MPRTSRMHAFIVTSVTLVLAFVAWGVIEVLRPWRSAFALGGLLGWVLPVVGIVLIAALSVGLAAGRVQRDAGDLVALGPACPECGRFLKEEWRLCPFCGTLIRDERTSERASVSSAG